MLSKKKYNVSNCKSIIMTQSIEIAVDLKDYAFFML
jgi:hypothetical protein